ncbi:flocculation protein FLO11 [Puntigrus tetrazona]|uniref:flocculation protein FLO11 n=1 Tax=Puntigrus tetrazona TaxID=1606681 RepID=UPI001C88E56A|nr:flocculation protein FLO11 [Puntigrus tetrazona]XP_043088499.1 flocculation protein FLO11 [Puntigrus tetrazona]
MEYHGSGTLPLLGSPRYCPGTNSASGYLCQTGHCCQETGCCTYYYELWWFWLLWSVLILFSCCCAYRHRQAKQRVQQQQRQREINLMAYHGACSYPSSMFDLSFLASLKLPSYEEVAAQPSTPPPPYSSVAYPRGSAHPGPSHMLSSQSSDNYTSCSCDSCCPSSPCSSSPSSAQLTDETDTSHASTPSLGEPGHTHSAVMHTECVPIPPIGEGGQSPTPSTAEVVEAELPSPAPLESNASSKPVKNITSSTDNVTEIADASQSVSTTNANGANNTTSPNSTNITSLCHPTPPSSSSSSLQLFSMSDPLGVCREQQSSAAQREEPVQAPPPQSPPRTALFSPGVEPERRDSAVSDLDVDQTHFQQRRLTGDSGIEVCRCRVEREEEEDEEEEERLPAELANGAEDALHDSPDCSARARPDGGGKEAWPISSVAPPTDTCVIAMETDRV